MPIKKSSSHCEHCIFYRYFSIKDVAVNYCAQSKIFKPISADVPNCCYFEKQTSKSKKPYKD